MALEDPALSCRGADGWNDLHPADGRLYIHLLFFRYVDSHQTCTLPLNIVDKCQGHFHVYNQHGAHRESRHLCLRDNARRT